MGVFCVSDAIGVSVRLPVRSSVVAGVAVLGLRVVAGPAVCGARVRARAVKGGKESGAGVFGEGVRAGVGFDVGGTGVLGARVSGTGVFPGETGDGGAGVICTHVGYMM